MGAPGRLDPSELAPVGYDQALKIVASWYQRADDEMLAVFGRRMVVYRPNGGYRTIEENAALPGSSPLSNHMQGRAVDIDNHRWFRDRDEARFISILNKNGFYNQNIYGQPFPSEPWHWRNMLSAGTAGGGGVPIPVPRQQTGDQDVILLKGPAGEYLVGDGYAHHLTLDESTQVQTIPANDGSRLIPIKDCGTNGAAFNLIMSAYTKNQLVVDTTTLATQIAAQLPELSASQIADIVVASVTPLFEAVPTAEENGTAARAAIVK